MTTANSTKGIRYAHTNLIATDWRRMMDFYCQVFGCRPVSSERDLKGAQFEALTAIPGATARGQHVLLPGHGEGGPTLEIFQYRENDPTLPPVINRPGFTHIAFEVPDIKSKRAEVLAWGGRDYGKFITLDIPGAGILTVLYVCDPEGNIIELQKWQRIEQPPAAE